LSDVDPTDGSGDAGSGGGGLASLFNTTPKVIGSISGLLVAVSGLLIALNKAGLVGGDTDPKTTSEKTISSQPPPSSQPPTAIFSEFDRRNGKLYFQDGTMYIQAKQTRSPVVALSKQEAPRDVVMSTRVVWEKGAFDYGVSLICRRTNARNYYLLGVLPSKGRYNIAMYRDGRLVSLAHGTSRHVGVKGNDLTVRCLGGENRLTTLTLGVKVGAKEKEIAQGYDDKGLAAGDVGIRVGSNERKVTVGFEEFSLK
jgi:hypothetical protein